MRLPLAFLALLALPAAASAQNPVTNGGFEVGPDRAPEGWGPVGQRVERTRDARSGEWGLRIERGAGPGVPAEVGLNRAWGGPATGQGAMLAQTRGGIRFWYRIDAAAPDADVRWVVIPMGATSSEDTGQLRTTLELRHEPGGGWREARLAYDYSAHPAVRWVHIGVRLTAGAAVLLLDDVEWVPRVGAAVQVARPRVHTDPRRTGETATLSVQVRNVGDEPVAGLSARIEAPPGIRTTQIGAAPAVAPGGAEVVRWRLTGRLTPGAVRVTAAAGETRDEVRLSLAPEVEIHSVLLSPGVLRPGERASVVATVRNRGSAWSSPVRIRLGPGGGSRVLARATVATAAIPPGGHASVRWPVAAPRQPGAFGLTAALDGLPGRPSSTATGIATHALDAPFERIAGPLGVRRGTDRTIGELRIAGSGRPVARLPHLGTVVVELPDGGQQVLVARYGRLRRSGAQTTASATATDRAGGVWRFGLSAGPASPHGVRLAISVRCSQPRRIRHFEGPALLAGDGSTGALKRDAILPGLEWLVAGEVSSSDLDIAANHPDRIRFLPHPHKVTVPAMGVRTPTATVGLLWEPSAAIQPVFAVPDRLGGVAAHRMALALPSVANGRAENEAVSGRPLALAGGQVLRIEALVVADPTAADSLAALDHWSRAYRARPARPAPRGDDRRQVAWSMEAYLNSLWVSEAERWRPFLGGPAIWNIPSFRPDFVYDLREAALISPSDPRAAAWQARAAVVEARGVTPLADDHGFAYQDPIPHLAALAAQAAELARSQLPAGGWPFDAYRRDTGVFRGMDYNELGPHGAVEVGTIAASAYRILLYARLTGDATAYQAGVRALRRIEGFTVPRAAQAWEVPVRTPDVLAAADAVDAFLEAYRFTKAEGRPDRRWLAEARRWARAGLPFIYMWDAPGRPWMRHGSIPVFGATWFEGSWFGHIVQWNGLRYAYALWKLHQYDPHARFGGLSWRDLATGITRSAMYQQSTAGPNLALWPDALHTVTLARIPWEFAPRQILKNVYALMGRAEEPATTGVRMGDATVRVSLRGALVGSRWHAGSRVAASRLVLTVRPAPGAASRVVVAGIAPPQAVVVNGERLAPVGERGWHHDPSSALLSVPLQRDARGLCTITVVGPTPARPTAFSDHLRATVARTLSFDFGRDTDGWTAARDLRPLTAAGGLLLLQTTGGDPYLIRPNCRFAPTSVREILMRVRATGDGTAQLFWTTEASPQWDEARSTSFTIPADGAWHEVIVPVGSHPEWRGATITGLRIDPAVRAGARAEIDWIRGR
ncbi:MAG TPA: hypothetical protein VLH79_15110 [Chthonomonadales bacterium]|nr:hypothetical protein [Chthonomonadales bacterium]